jgi:DNA adenine methylase
VLGSLVGPLKASQQTLDGSAHEARPKVRSPLKWAGGKRWLARQIETYYEPFRERRLVEPFCGGLSVALALSPKKALLNDINPHLINFYQQIKKGLEIDIDFRSTSATFYRYREEFNELISSKEHETPHAAKLFYYLNRTCYNGLSRFNQAGKFNVPFGKYKKPVFLRDFSAYKTTFAAWEFTSGDFSNLQLGPLDFVYADPPYDGKFTQYAKEGFSWTEQERLVEWLDKHAGPTVLSNTKTGKIRRLYTLHKFELGFRHAPRMISCDGNRRKAVEVVATKNLLVRPVLPAAAIPAPGLGDVLLR